MFHLSHPRHIFAFVPDYNLIAFLLWDTDLVFTASREFAERFAAYLPLSFTPAPDFFPQLELRLLWHVVADQSRSCVWLHKIIVAAARGRKTLPDDEEFIIHLRIWRRFQPYHKGHDVYAVSVIVEGVIALLRSVRPTGYDSKVNIGGPLPDLEALEQAVARGLELLICAAKEADLVAPRDRVRRPEQRPF